MTENHAADYQGQVVALRPTVTATWTPGDVPGQRIALLALLFDGLDAAAAQPVPPVRPNAPRKCQPRKAAVSVIGAA